MKATCHRMMWRAASENLSHDAGLDLGGDVSSGIDVEAREECADALFDVVADGSDRVDALAGWIVELPVFVALTWIPRAFVADRKSVV